MHNSIFDALKTFKGLPDDMLSRLSQHLDRYVVGDKILLDKSAQKCVFRLARSGKSHLDLLEADLTEQLEKLKLFFKTHRDHKRLIAVAKIHRAPYGRFCQIIFLDPLRLLYGSGKILSCVLTSVHYINLSYLFGALLRTPLKELLQKFLENPQNLQKRIWDRYFGRDIVKFMLHPLKG
jgi:hypothetical protein